MLNTNDNLTLHEVLSIQDPAWESWQAIYYESFPKNERMTERFFLRRLKKKAAGRARNDHFLVMSEQDVPHRILGIAYFQVLRKLKAGYLWYLATRTGHRGQGLGAALYGDILRRVRDTKANILIFEVEQPELMAKRGAEHRELAVRRIEWYRRQGACFLGGVRYLQKVDAPVAPTEMHVMAHPIVPMTPKEVFKIAVKLFKKDIRKTGPLTLT